MRTLSGFERLLMLLGLLLLSIYGIARIYRTVSSRWEVQQFWQARQSPSRDGSVNTAQSGVASPNFQLWSEKRIEAYKASFSSQFPPALAVLKIPAINLEVPVLQGTDDLTLNRGAGHIDGTAIPGGDGNIGIAGHRDGFFRGLKDVHEGDEVELFTQNSTDRYIVDEILIVAPEDVSVLQPTTKPSLTLVTCYPFYFVGSAPQRYIVRASIANSTVRGKAGQQSLLAEKGGGQEKK